MNRLTRDFEAKLPEFISHQDARTWFKEQFKDDFMLTGSEVIDGEKMYFYHLIVDKEAYNKGMKALSEEGFTTGLELAMSYHTVEISEDGRVHIVY